MRFLVDECTGPVLAAWLRTQGHDVFSVYDQARGIDDDQVITLAFANNRILVTNDKDFGEKIYREKRPHRGVILLRLNDERSKSKIAALARVLAEFSDRIESHFIVVTESQVRISAK